MRRPVSAPAARGGVARPMSRGESGDGADKPRVKIVTKTLPDGTVVKKRLIFERILLLLNNKRRLFYVKKTARAKGKYAKSKGDTTIRAQMRYRDTANSKKLPGIASDGK